MNLQYSRGCPFSCEFCDITTLYGNRTRTKNTGQIIDELEALYDAGWRGSVFFVDDNFIGNKKKIKDSLPPRHDRLDEEKKAPLRIVDGGVDQSG